MQPGMRKVSILSIPSKPSTLSPKSVLQRVCYYLPKSLSGNLAHILPSCLLLYVLRPGLDGIHEGHSAGEPRARPEHRHRLLLVMSLSRLVSPSWLKGDECYMLHEYRSSSTAWPTSSKKGLEGLAGLGSVLRKHQTINILVIGHDCNFGHCTFYPLDLADL